MKSSRIDEMDAIDQIEGGPVGMAVKNHAGPCCYNTRMKPFKAGLDLEGVSVGEKKAYPGEKGGEFTGECNSVIAIACHADNGTANERSYDPGVFNSVTEMYDGIDGPGLIQRFTDQRVIAVGI